MSAIGDIILATIIVFRIRFWVGLAALSMLVGWSRLARHAIGRANLLQDDFPRLNLENERAPWLTEPGVKEAGNRQIGATLPRPPNAYSVIEAGNTGFQVIEAQPDGGEPRVLAAFTTRAAATEWLGDLLGIPRPPGDIENLPVPPYHPWAGCGVARSSSANRSPSVLR